MAHGKYMAECANSANIGFFNGVFMTLANIGRTFGFFLGAYLIIYLEVSTFFWVLTCFTLASSSMMCLLPKPIPREETPGMKPKPRKPVCENLRLTCALVVEKRMGLFHAPVIFFVAAAGWQRV